MPDANTSDPSAQSETSKPDHRREFIPRWLDEAKLSASQFRIFCHVSRRGVCFASIETIARVCRLHADTVRAVLKELVKRKMLVCETRSGKPSIYRVSPAPLGKEGSGALGKGGRPTPPKAGEAKVSPLQGNPEKVSPLRGGTVFSNTKKSTAEEETCDDHNNFMQLWREGYPKYFEREYTGTQGGRDRKQLAQLLRTVKKNARDLFKLVVKAWKRQTEFDFKFACTVHGFCDHYDDIVAAISRDEDFTTDPFGNKVRIEVVNRRKEN